MLRSTSVVITTIGACELMLLSPVSRPTLSMPNQDERSRNFLVGERLDGGGVEGLHPFLHPAQDGVLGDHRLASAGGGHYQGGFIVVQKFDGLLLKVIEGEVVLGVEFIRARDTHELYCNNIRDIM